MPAKPEIIRPIGGGKCPALQAEDFALKLLWMAHPCRSCGACCAFFRVEFYWREAGDAPHVVPTELTEEAGPHKMRMKGTNQKKALRCIALEGQIGKEVGCKIYHQRATPCHDFSASYEDGNHNPRCDQARAGHGLAPLSQEDWGRSPAVPSADKLS